MAAFDQLQRIFPRAPGAGRPASARRWPWPARAISARAEQIYRAEADYLLSDDRKQQIADIYLEFADAYSSRPRRSRSRDYDKALEFYRKALEVGPKPERRIEVELRVAECLQKLDAVGEAAALYQQFSKDHQQTPLDIEARYRLGECRLAEGNLKQARRVWQDLLANVPVPQAGGPSRIAEAPVQPGPDLEHSRPRATRS